MSHIGILHTMKAVNKDQSHDTHTFTQRQDRIELVHGNETPLELVWFLW